METRISTQRLIVGGLFITVGVLMLVGRLGLLDLDLELWDLWTFLFPAMFLSSLVRKDLGGAIVFLFLSALFVGPRLFPQIDMGDVLEQWPVVLVLIGISLVVRSFLPTSKPKAAKSGRSSAIFGNAVVSPSSANYRGGEITALLGAFTLDLTDSQLAPQGAVVVVFAFWGGIEIRVPKDMAVDQRVIPFMGGAEDKSVPPKALAPDQPRLEVRGFVWMAGLEIKN